MVTPPSSTANNERGTPSAAAVDAIVGPVHHSTVLPDGSVRRYLLRGLRDEDDDDEDGDLSAWARTCADAFAHKADPPPPSYFARHYRNDPRRDASLIRVMETTTTTTTTTTTANDGEMMTTTTTTTTMASSVRIFRRTLSSGRPSSIDDNDGDGATRRRHRHEAGGVGEVCTLPDHRELGLSSMLLRNALDIMRSLPPTSDDDDDDDGDDGDGGDGDGCGRRRMSCSFLHASPTYRRYYEKVGGYASVRSEWSVVPVDLGLIDDDHDGGGGGGPFFVRRAEFPRDVGTLRRLHASYSEERFVTVVRSRAYWEAHVRAESVDDGLWVLAASSSSVRRSPSASAVSAAAADEDDDGGGGGGDDVVVAWMSVRERGGRYQLREFGLDRDRLTTTAAVRGLLGAALGRTTGGGRDDDDDDCGGNDGCGGNGLISLLLPSFVLSEIKEERTNDVVVGGDGVGDASSSSSSSSLFVMIEDATEENDDGWMYVNFDESRPSLVDLITRAEDRIPHLIWPTDSF